VKDGSKWVSILLIAFLLILTLTFVGCNQYTKEDIEQARSAGHDAGYEDGNLTGYSEAEALSIRSIEWIIDSLQKYLRNDYELGFILADAERWDSPNYLYSIATNPERSDNIWIEDMDAFEQGYKSYASVLERQLAVIESEEPGHYEYVKGLKNPDSFRFPNTVPMTGVWGGWRSITDYFYPACNYR
jgi:hypothetical protein